MPRGSGGGGAVGRGQKCHCSGRGSWGLSGSLPGAAEAAPGAGPAWPYPARSEPRLRREEVEQGIALTECVKC